MSEVTSPRHPRERGGPAPSVPSDDFAIRLLTWFDTGGRHDLPWQHPRTPYRVWLSEIMLQQTQVRVVVPYFERFVTALPDLPALAAAPQDQVLALWSGLGYYARARNLHAAAKACVELHDGKLPRDLDALIALPGIGRSTAGAILAQAWGDRHPILDGNVKRVLCRWHGVEGWPGAPKVERRLWELAESHLPQERMADYVQAQMDLGATLCTRHSPSCLLCPVSEGCVALAQGRVAELPTPKPGKPLPQREAVVLLLYDDAGRVLLQRRPPTGVWASLWSLPQAEADEEARAWFNAHLRDDYGRGEPLDPVPHAFTHYRLTLQPRRWRGVSLRAAVRDDDSYRWVARTDLETIGIPAPVRRLAGRSYALDALRGDPSPPVGGVAPTYNGTNQPHEVTSMRKVFCQYEQTEAEGLDFAPWPGELGKRVYDNIGKGAWSTWLAHQTMLINENRLSPLDPKHRAFLEGEMKKFLFEGGADKPAGYVPEPGDEPSSRG